MKKKVIKQKDSETINREDPRITKQEAEENKKHGGSSQFRYDTPFGGGSAHDRAGAIADKKGRLTTRDEDFEEADAQVKRELGQEKSIKKS